MTSETLSIQRDLAQKQTLSRPKRFLRLILSAVDPRAWLHLVKLVNYYNYTHVRPRRSLSLGRQVAISPTVSFANAHNIDIGDSAHLGVGCSLWAGAVHGKIQAGRDLLMGPGIVITAAGYRFNDGSPVTEQLMEERSVTIGDDVWIGANATILPGATIADGAIIAAGAVVRGDVKAGQIMAGVPAKSVGVRRAN